MIYDIILGTNYRFRALVRAYRRGNGGVLLAIADSRFRKMGSKVLHSFLHEAIHAAGVEGLQVADDGSDESVVSSYQNQSNRIGRGGDHGVDRAIKPQCLRNGQGASKQKGQEGAS